MIKILEVLEKYPRLVFEGILVALLVLVGWLYNKNQTELNDVITKQEGLASNLRQQITFKQNELITVTRDLTGKIITHTVYVPAEGGVVISQPHNPANPGEIIITAKSRGLTFKPGLGLEWADRGVLPRLDFKFAYWNRWGLEFGGSPNGLGPSISRHVDDIVFGKPANIEPFIGYNIVRFNDSFAVVGGVRVNW